MTLAAEAVSFNYGNAPVLRDVSLGVDPGEVLTVVGPSGVGKTTLLRLLALFSRPDQGTVTWAGEDVWARSEADRLAMRRQITMVFQEASLFNAPVARNVTYGRRVRQPWPERVRESMRRLVGTRSLPASAQTALETVGLLEKADRNALLLSGGEAQRVAFARALAVDPTIVLLDEPASNLDPRNTALLEDAIHAATARGVGVVVATHDLQQAKRLSDRVGFLYNGDLVETGPPAQLFENPADPRTRRFLDGDLLYDVEDAEANREQPPTPESR